MAKGAGGRLAYADLLRVVSTLAVIAAHLSVGWMQAVPVGTADWDILNVWNSLCRCSVPVFIMLSGMFFLDPKKPLPLTVLLFKYIFRLAAALAAWSVFYALVDNWPGWGALSPAWLLSCLRAVLLGQMHTHLWYLYMIIGLYLVSPVLRAFVKGASRSDFHWFFALCLLFVFLLPTLLRLRPSATASLYLDRLQIHLVLGYTGYFVAGYYLKAYPPGRAARCLIYALGAAGALVTVWGTALFSRADGQLNALFYSNFSPGVAAMGICVFILCHSLFGAGKDRPRRRFLEAAGSVTFGIYLVHDFFIFILRRFDLAAPPIPPVIAVPLLTTAVFFPSLGVAWLLSKIPFVGRYLA